MSRLGFGTARLHHSRTTARRRLIERALEVGITHFDTAPCYGDTLAESALGEALGLHRSRVVIATKYGIPADRIIAAVPSLRFPLRAARALAHRVGRGTEQRATISSQGLVASVEQSLRRLRTDFVDLLLLHEPSRERLPDPDAMLVVLDRLKRDGKIRYFGLAGEWSDIEGLGETRSKLGQVVQTSAYGVPADKDIDILYGVMAVGAQSIARTSISSDAAVVRLQSALVHYERCGVIVSTSDPDRIETLAAASVAAIPHAL